VKTLVRIVNITAKDKFAICPDSRVRSQLPELNRQTQKKRPVRDATSPLYLPFYSIKPESSSTKQPKAKGMRTIAIKKERHLLLSLLQLSGIKFQLLALQHVAVAATALARSGRYGAQQAAAGESLIQSRVQSAGLLSLGLVSLNVVRNLLLGTLLSGGLLLGLLHADLDTIVLLIPSLERGRVNLDDGTLHQSLGAHQLVVGGVVNDVQDTSLSSADCNAKWA
jgi:hypothetical protein